MSNCKVPDCGGITEYDDDAQAVLCTTCGVVATQEILSEVDHGFIGNSLYFGPTTLRSLRRIGGVLAGQSSKEDRDRRNTVAMHKYIAGILSRLGYSGLAPRAHSLFDQARVRGGYRWGGKAHLVAGACIAVTLRESRKGITMSHLASLIDVSSHSLCRMFTHVNAHLALQISVLDPIALFPRLQSDLKTLMSSPVCPLPHATAEIIQQLPPAPVLRLAISLANIVSCLDGAVSSGASVPAVACALLILALEGQAASSLPSYVLLAQELGKKVGASKDLVVGRYREICKVIKEWMEDVPWISGSDHPDNKAGPKRRKMSQRSVIAMGLKDVVEFKEEILRTRKEREIMCPVTVSLDIAQDEKGECHAGNSHKVEGSVLPIKKRKRSPETSSTSKYLRFTRSRLARPLTSLDIASLSLLSPSHPLVSDIGLETRLAQVSAVDDMRTQILTSSVFPADVPLTRLQSLAVTRGGESQIEDDELFEEGELEGLLRDENEVVKLRERDNLECASPDHRKRQHQSSRREPDWAWEDLATWGDLGGSSNSEKPPFDISEHVPIGSREPSPSDWGVEVGDGFDIQGDW